MLTSRAMGLTFLMSYPGADWQIRGAQNSFSRNKPATNPKAALKEWLRLGDAMVKAGARIAVMRPDEKGILTGMPYTSNLGSLFRQTQGAPFYIADSPAKHRKGEADRVANFLKDTGVPTARCKASWQGQSEVQILPGNRIILSHGPRSTKEAVEELRAAVVPGARIMEVQTKETCLFGDATLSTLTARNGDCVLLVSSEGLASRSLPELRSFAGSYADVIPIEDPDDATKMATQSFTVGGTAFIPVGLSTSFRSNLVKRGFLLEEVDLPELLGKGGGGPRALVNELRGLVLADEGPSYHNLRDELDRLVEKYPEKATSAKPVKEPK